MSKIYNLEFTETRPLPSPAQLKEELPLPDTSKRFVLKMREQIKKILNQENPRLLMVAGPCSIHDMTAAKEYAEKMGQLADEVSDSFLLVMRVYFEKPRTKTGWKGLAYDPLLDQSYDMDTGLRWTRQLLLDIAEMGVAAGAEFLDPNMAPYFEDLISWGCIGARTAESQIHRQLASGLPMPVAFKNNTDGNVEIATHGILAAAHTHTYMGTLNNGQIGVVQTKGNPNCHVVLRGGHDKPNYDEESVGHVLKLLDQAKLPHRLLVDCSHENSKRRHEKQSEVFRHVMEQILAGNTAIRGMTLESNLFAGNQPLTKDPTQLRYAISVTDACLDWPTTERLLRWAHTKFIQAKKEWTTREERVPETVVN